MSFVLCRDNERERVNLKPLSLESHPSLILIAVPIFDTVMLGINKDDKLAENNHQPIFFKNSILLKAISDTKIIDIRKFLISFS